MFTKKIHRPIAMLIFVVMLLGVGSDIPWIYADDILPSVSTPSGVGQPPAATTFTSRYTPASQYSVDSVGFLYSTDPSFQNVTPMAATSISALSVDGGNFTVKASLDANKMYFVRAYATIKPTGGTPRNIYSASTITYSTRISYTQPDVSTTDAYHDSGVIRATGQVNRSDSDITERGFVVSTSNGSPTTSDSKYVVSGTVGSFNHSFAVSYNATYYVRAYAINASGIPSYGDTKTVYTYRNQYPTVSTETISYVGDYNADVVIDVTDEGSSSVYERGVVYSKETSRPELDTYRSYNRTASGTTGRATVNLNNLDYDTKYYVRAYAKNNYDTSYGDVKSFTTGQYWNENSYWYSGSSNSRSSSDVSTYSVTDIRSNSAVAEGYIYSSSSYSIKERGFVYSSTSKNPTTNDKKAYDTNSSSGSYKTTLTNLTSSTTYYVRAYFRNSNGTYYGDTQTFTTRTNDSALISVTYKTQQGATVGTQSITAAIDTSLTASRLNLPSGYVLYNTNWDYTVTRDANINVLVEPSSAAKTSLSKEPTFMPSAEGFQFKPNTAITRGEIAQIIYNLSDKQQTGTPLTFNDTASGSYQAAVDYASAQGYMAGYPDGSFRPNDPLSRAEMAVILCTVYKLNGTATHNLTDVPASHWAYQYVALSTQAKMITGYPDKTYKPDNKLTRAEACVLFSKAEHRSLAPFGTTAFNDVPSSHWAYAYIMNAAVPVPAS